MPIDLLLLDFILRFQHVLINTQLLLKPRIRFANRSSLTQLLQSFAGRDPKFEHEISTNNSRRSGLSHRTVYEDTAFPIFQGGVDEGIGFWEVLEQVLVGVIVQFELYVLVFAEVVGFVEVKVYYRDDVLFS